MAPSSDTIYRYRFTARPAGTYWWHSHSHLQREDGLYGRLGVWQPDGGNVHRDRYDEDRTEHVILLQDWVHRTGTDMFLDHHFDRGSNKADSFLINGRGRYENCLLYTSDAADE